MIIDGVTKVFVHFCEPFDEYIFWHWKFALQRPLVTLFFWLCFAKYWPQKSFRNTLRSKIHMFIKVRHKILLHNFVEFRDAQSNAQSYLRKDSRMFLASFYLILQTSLVSKLGGHHHNCFDSQSNRVVKNSYSGPFIFCSGPLKLSL